MNQAAAWGSTSVPAKPASCNVSLRYGAQRGDRRADAGMERFRSHHLGQFIHFGLYALPAGSWDGHRYDFAAEFLPKSAGIGPPQWAQLADQFRLENFDANVWAEAADRMGARYVTVTTKHHEGFCLWPTEHSSFHVGNTPYGRDLLDEVITAYQRRNIAVHLYYSVLDWHHPDWRYRIDGDDDHAAFRRYLDYAEAQLVELAERYPAVAGFWLDGTWDDSVKANGWWTYRIEHRLKELIPGAVVNSRLRADDNGARHFDSNGRLMGDFESGYERRLPQPWDLHPMQWDWEACMTISQATWGYHAGEWAQQSVKHPWEVVDMLAHCTAQGGNFLLNFGPMGDGRLQPRELAVADQVGRWLSAGNGAAIFGCGPACGWDYPGWGYFTASNDGSTVYAIVTRRPAGGELLVELPTGVEIATIVAAATSQSSNWYARAHDQIRIRLPTNASSDASGPYVLALHLKTGPDH